MKIYYHNITIDLSKLPKNRPRFGDDLESQDRKKAWCDALWGGFYKQGHQVLHCVLDNSYCCLGVKTALENRLLWGSTYKGIEKCINIFGSLPAGAIFNGERQCCSLVDMNDGQPYASFKEIAFVIQHVF